MTGHRSILESGRLDWRDEHDCAAAARRLAAEPALAQAVVELSGPLGAGKTSFVRHLLRALGVEGRVRSPSYALMESYRLASGDAWHFDFYRFDDAREWEDAGFREVFASPGLKLVEWPERAEALLPLPDLRLRLEPGDRDQRTVLVEAPTERGTALLGALCPPEAPR